MTHEPLIDSNDEENSSKASHPHQCSGRVQIVIFLCLITFFVFLWSGTLISNRPNYNGNSTMNSSSNSTQQLQFNSNFPHLQVSISLTQPVASSQLSLSQIKVNPKFFSTIKFEEKTNDFCSLQESERFDCDPMQDADEQVCSQRGCCWQPTAINRSVVVLSTPYCFFPSNYNPYRITKHKQDDGYLAVELTRQFKFGLFNETSKVYLVVSIERVNFMLITISNKDFDSQNRSQSTKTNRLYSRNRKRDKQFVSSDVQMTGEVIDNQIHILRVPDRFVLWQANLNTLLFSDNFIQLDTRLSNDRNIYGLGDHFQQFRKTFFNYTRYTHWPRQGRSLVGPNLHVDQMAYLQLFPNSSYSFVLTLDNNYGAEIILRPGPAITWRTLGGSLRFLMSVGPNPLEAVSSFQWLAHRPNVPPLWSLGFQMGQPEFTSVHDFRKLIESNLNAGIRIDAIAFARQLWHKDRLFSIDPSIETDLLDFLDWIKSNNQHVIASIHPAIDGDTLDQNFTNVCNFDRSMLLKNANDSPLRTRMLSHNVSYIVDVKQNAVAYQTSVCLLELHKTVHVEGFDLEFTRPDTLVDGSLDGCPYDSRLERPDYKIGGWSEPLSFGSVCMGAKMIQGNLYSDRNFRENYADLLLDVFINFDERAFVIGPNPQSVAWGGYAGTFHQDLNATWDHMRHSLNYILTTGMFGISLTGSTICGNAGEPEVELCARWYSLGAFYPLARHRPNKNEALRDPVSVGPEVVAAAKYAFKQRFALLPTLYSAIIEARLSGSPVVRPMFLNYPLDPQCASIDTQFMWSDQLLVVPVLQPNQTKVNAYLPPGRWFSFPSYQEVSVSKSDQGRWEEFAAPLDHIPLFIPGGRIVMIQKPHKTVELTYDKSTMEMHVFLDSDGEANSFFNFDDGKQFYFGKRPNTALDLRVADNKLRLIRFYSHRMKFNRVSQIQIHGLKAKPSKLIFNEEPIDQITFVNNILVVDVEFRLNDQIYLKWFFDSDSSLA